MIQPNLDPARLEAFEGRLLETLNGAALALMLSVGHRTGLFDALAGLPGVTSAELARAAGVDERYTREWLGALVTAGVVEHDAEAGTYRLPPEHAARLTRSASPANLAVPMQWIAVLGRVEDRIVECFRRGGGVPYEAFERFHEVMAEDSAQTTLAALLDGILELATGLRGRLERGLEVLEVGCGQGRALLELAAAFPRSRFTGYDLSSQAIASANVEATRRGLGNVRFAARDVTVLDEPGRYDLVLAFDAIHDQHTPERVLREIAAALRPTGLFLMQDIRASSRLERNVGHPLAPFFYTISTMHCMTVSLAGGGAGLGTCWGEELALEMLAAAGFAHVDVRQLEHDIQNNYYIARPRAGC
jgi:2-polyprenyl-3-methyl-5-hydroxy-6-metoxy-1,4-benzoquinol methylase